jgi:hypothetical protein
MQTVRGIAASLLAPLRHAGSDLAADMVERLVIGGLAAVAVAFALAAATIWVALRHGALTATLVMAAAFAALSLVAWLARVARRRARRRRRRIETERARAVVATATQAASWAADLGAAVGSAATDGRGVSGLAADTARDAARRVNPWLLLLAAAAAGYAGGRGSRS